MFYELKIVFQCANRVINNNNDKLIISYNKGTCFAAFQQLQELEVIIKKKDNTIVFLYF